MKNYARVVDGIAVETIEIPDDFNLNGIYVADVAAQFVACTADVASGWTYAGKKFSAPVASPPSPQDLTAYAASRRYAVETGGILLNGMQVMTDRASQSLITGAYNYVQANPSALVKFKTAAGFVELTATQMTAVANAVGAHVQASFAAEAAVDAAISGGTIKTFADIDATSWPANA